MALIPFTGELDSPEIAGLKPFVGALDGEPTTSTPGEIARGIGRGVFDTVKMGAQTIQTAIRPSDPTDVEAAQGLKTGNYTGHGVYDYLGEVAKKADEYSGSDILKAHPDQHGAVVNTFAEGAQSIAPSIAPMALAAIPVVGPALAIGTGGAVFGASQAQQDYESARAAGKSHDDAVKMSSLTGGIEGLGETAGEAALLKLFSSFGGAKAKVAATAFQKFTNPVWLKEFGKDWLVNAGIQSATEFGQNAGEAAVRNAYGVGDNKPLEEGVHGAVVAGAMSVLMGPFAGAGHYSNAKQRADTAKILQEPPESKDPEQQALIVAARTQAANNVFEELKAADPKVAQEWRTSALEAIATGKPVTLSEVTATNQGETPTSDATQLSPQNPTEPPGGEPPSGGGGGAAGKDAARRIQWTQNRSDENLQSVIDNPASGKWYVDSANQELERRYPTIQADTITAKVERGEVAPGAIVNAAMAGESSGAVQQAATEQAAQAAPAHNAARVDTLMALSDRARKVGDESMAKILDKMAMNEPKSGERLDTLDRIITNKEAKNVQPTANIGSDQRTPAQSSNVLPGEQGIPAGNDVAGNGADLVGDRLAPQGAQPSGIAEVPSVQPAVGSGENAVTQGEQNAKPKGKIEADQQQALPPDNAAIGQDVPLAAAPETQVKATDVVAVTPKSPTATAPAIKMLSDGRYAAIGFTPEQLRTADKKVFIDGKGHGIFTAKTNKIQLERALGISKIPEGAILADGDMPFSKMKQANLVIATTKGMKKTHKIAPIEGGYAIVPKATAAPEIKVVAEAVIQAAPTVPKNFVNRKAVVFQNRDRSTPALISQMQGIAKAPDYTRVAPGYEATSGAPIVEGELPPSAVMGKKSIANTANKKLEVQYAVVEADDLIASHNVDGSPVAGYEQGEPGKLRAIGGNARVAGIKEAYRAGSASEYATMLRDDTAHGVTAEAIAGMKNPVLVRVMRSEDVTPNIGIELNARTNAAPQIVDQAKDDARSFKIENIELSEDGSPSSSSLKQFVLAMPENERAGMMDRGQPNKNAQDRLNAAIFYQAYGNDELVRIYAESTDEEAKAVISALASAAPSMAKLEGSDVDVRDVVVDAAKIAINARRQGKSLLTASQQGDIEYAQPTMWLVKYFAENIRAPRRIGEMLVNLANRAHDESTKQGVDLWGDKIPKKTAEQLLQEQGYEQRPTQGNEQQVRPELISSPVRREANVDNGQNQAQAGEEPAQARQPESTYALESQTQSGLDERAKRIADAKKEADKLEAKLIKEEKDRLEHEDIKRRSVAAASTFELGGDAQANLSGQNSLFQKAKHYDPNQLDLLINDQPLRPGEDTAKTRADRTGLAASTLLRGSRGSLLGLSLSTDWIAGKGSSLLGKRITSPADLATLGAVLRDPRAETMRYFLIKEGKVVYHTAVSSRLLGSSAAFIGEPEAFISDLKATMEKLGADGYYLMHNHPARLVRASASDVHLTSKIANELPGFLGHVILDHTEFGLIKVSHDISQKKSKVAYDDGAQPLNVTGTDPTRTNPIPHAKLDEVVSSPQALARIADIVRQPDNIVLVATDHQMHVTGIMQVSRESMKKGGISSLKIMARLRKVAGAYEIFAVLPDGMKFDELPKHITNNGWLIDVHIAVAGKGVSAVNENMMAYQRGGAKRKDKLGMSVDQPGVGYAQKQTDTPEFKAWFGNSRVVDSDGKPLVVYHGTPDADFNEFRPESYFADSGEIASIYTSTSASSISSSAKDGSAPAVMPVYLKIEKPFDTRIPANRKLFETKFYMQRGTGTELSSKGLPDWNDARDLAEWIQEEGLPFDGIMLDEGGLPQDDGSVKSRGISYVALNGGAQVKSAIGNNGQYSLANPSIVQQPYSNYQSDLFSRMEEAKNEETAIAERKGSPQSDLFAKPVKEGKLEEWQKPAAPVADLFNQTAKPAAESNPKEILIKQPYGVNTMAGIAEFEQAKETASSAPENTIIRVRIEKDGLYEHEPVKTLYGAFVANGDGTATWAQARFPASKENPTDAQIMELAEADRLSNKETEAKIAEQARKNKAGLADKGIVVGLELQSPSTYVPGKKGMTTFTRAKVVAIDDHGIAEVHATLKGSGKTYVFKADAHSRLFEKLETKLTQEQQATAILDRANVTGKDRLDIMREFKDGKHSLDDLEKAYPAKNEAASSGTPEAESKTSFPSEQDVAENIGRDAAAPQQFDSFVWQPLPVPSFIEKNRAQYEAQSDFTESERDAQTADSSIEFDNYPVEFNLRQLNNWLVNVKEINGALLGGSRGASPKELIGSWVAYNKGVRALAKWKQSSPEKWLEYEARQRNVSKLDVGDKVVTSYRKQTLYNEEPETYTYTVTRKNKINWSLDQNGNKRLEPASLLMTEKDAQALSAKPSQEPKAEQAEISDSEYNALIAMAEKENSLAPGSMRRAAFIEGVNDGVYGNPQKRTNADAYREGYAWGVKNNPAKAEQASGEGAQNEAKFSQSATPARNPNNFKPNEANREYTDKLEAAIKRGGNNLIITPVNTPREMPVNMATRIPGGDTDARNVSRSSARLAERVAGLFGKEVIWIKSQGDFSIDGVVEPVSMPDKIFISANTPIAAHVVMGHELSHHLENDAPTIYKRLTATLEKLIKNRADFRVKYNLQDFSERQLTKEMVGNIMGDSFSHPEFWKDVAKANPMAARSIGDKVMAWLNKLAAKISGVSGYGSSEIVTDVNEARRAVAEAVAQYALQRRGAQESNANELYKEAYNPQYSTPIARFYSQLRKVVRDLNDKIFQGSAANVKLHLMNNLGKYGIKKDEIFWTGLGEFLSMDKKVSKADVLGFLDENSVQVKDVVLGERDMGVVEAWWNDEGGANEETPFSDLSTSEQRAASERYQDEVGNYQEEGAPKFPTQVLPGGRDYRELLIALPAKTAQVTNVETLTSLPDGYDVSFDQTQPVGMQYAIIPPGQIHGRPYGDIRGGTPEEAKIGALEKLNIERQINAHNSDNERNSKLDFVSGHYPDTKNLIAHVRLNTRDDAQGRVGTFAEEQQSDWGIAGSKDGFGTIEEDRAKLADIEKRIEIARQRNLGGEYRVEENTPASTGKTEYWVVVGEGRNTNYSAGKFNVKEVAEAKVRELEKESPENSGLYAERDRLQNRLAKRSFVPPAPFVTSATGKGSTAHTLLSLKKTILYAIEQGHEFVSWTTGAQQKDRYDLSKQIRNVTYDKNGTLAAYDHSGVAVIDEHGVPENKLADYIGKGPAEELLKSEPDKNGHRHVEGEGLKVGGEWADTLYGDENGLDANGKPSLMTQAVKEVARQLGVELKVEPIGLPNIADAYTVKLVAPDNYALKRGAITIEDGFATPEEAREKLAEIGEEEGGAVSSQPGFTITPELRSKVTSAGMPLFSIAPNQNQYGTLTDAQSAAISNVVGQPKSMLERAKEFGKDWQKNLVQGIVDQYAPIKEYSMIAYIKARMSKGSASTLEAIFMYGKPRIDTNGDITGDFSKENGGKNGFASVLAPLDGEHDRFILWIAALRAERLKGIGLENLWSKDDINTLKTLNVGKLQNGNDRAAAYTTALKGLNEYNDAILAVASARGLINDSTRKMYQDTPYVPFYRLTEEDVVPGFSATAGMVNQTAWKKLKGGTQKLNEDLLANMLQNWSHLIEASARNDAAKATLTAAIKVGAATEVPNGYPGKGTVSFRDNVVRTIPAGKEYEEGGVTKVSDGTAQIEENVERTFMVSDPHLMDAITSIGNTLHVPKVLKQFKHLLTTGVTMNPAFKLRNLIRDSAQSMALGDLSYNPAKNIAKGIALTKFNSETRAKMLFGGGMIRFGSMLDGNSADMARELVNNGIPHDHILDNDSKIKGMWDHYIKPAFDAYQEIGDRGEQVNRAALFDILTKPVSEGGKGMTQGEANYWARDLMDFSMSGKWQAIRFLTQTVPFMNARLQGLYKLGKSAKADKKRFGIVVGGVAMASLMLLAAYGDDDDWKKREDWDRDNYWWFKIGGHAFRIPKPFEIGAIGTIAERGVELMYDNEMTGRRFRERLGNIVSQQLSMNPTPQLVKPMIDLWANKDSFSGRPIETMGMEKLKPEDRIGSRTTGIAKTLGMIGLPNPAQLMMGNYEQLSPVQIDFLIRGYFSWLGTSTTTALEYGIFKPFQNTGEAPAMKLRDVFFAGNFAESLPSSSSRYVTQMYGQAKEIEEAYNSYHAALKSGDMERAADIMASDKGKIQQYHSVERIKKQESIINTRIKLITVNRRLSGEDKARQIDLLNHQKDQLARRLHAF